MQVQDLLACQTHLPLMSFDRWAGNFKKALHSRREVDKIQADKMHLGDAQDLWPAESSTGSRQSSKQEEP